MNLNTFYLDTRELEHVYPEEGGSDDLDRQIFRKIYEMVILPDILTKNDALFSLANDLI